MCPLLSIYLQDFTTGDAKITQHLQVEMDRDDWKALVLHYPGLDCLAHFGGSKG